MKIELISKQHQKQTENVRIFQERTDQMAEYLETHSRKFPKGNLSYRRTIEFSTSNYGKVAEVEAVIQSNESVKRIMGERVRLATMTKDKVVDVEEDQDTFYGNAVKKASLNSQVHWQSLVLAEDSGIIVPALGGAPGVFSARYAERESPEGVPLTKPIAEVLRAMTEDSPGCSNGAKDRVDLLNKIVLIVQLASRFGWGTTHEAYFLTVSAVCLNGELLSTGHGALYGTVEVPTKEQFFESIEYAKALASDFGYNSVFGITDPKGDYCRLSSVPTLERVAWNHRGMAHADAIAQMLIAEAALDFAP